MNNLPNSAHNPENQFRKNVEKELEESRQLLKKIEEVAGIGYWEIDLLTGKNKWSEKFFRICGLDSKRTEPSTELGFSLVHPEDREFAQRAYESSIKNGNPYKIEKRIIRPSGDIRYVISEGIVEKDQTGLPIRLFGVFKDITKEKNIKKELLERNRFIEATLANLPVGLAVNRISDGKATYMNKAFSELCGWPPEDLTDVDSFFNKIYPDPEFRESITHQILEDIKSGDPERMFWKDIPITTKDGTQRIISAKNIALPDLDIMISTVTDDTDRYWAEHSLRVSDERFHLVTQAVSDAIWVWDIEKSSIFLGRGYSRLFGYQEEIQLVSRDFLLSKIHPEDIEITRNSIQEACRNPNTDRWSGEYRFQTFDGKYVFVKENTVIIRDPDGKPIRIVGALQDISQEIKVQNSVLQKTRLIETTALIIQSLLEVSDWQLLLERSLKLMGETVDADRTYFFKNYKDPRTGRLFSQQIREWTNGNISSEINNPSYQAIPLDEHPDFLKSVYQKKPFELFTSDCKGETRAILQAQNIKSILQIPIFVENQFYGYIGFDDCTKSRIWNEDEKNFLKSITTNLSFAIERKQNLDKIQEALESRNSILERIGDAFFAVDKDWKVIYWNKRSEEILGIKREDIVGIELWGKFPQAKDLEFFKNYERAFKTQQPVSFEEYFPPLNQWYEVNAYPSPEGISVFFRDISGKKSAEQQIIQANDRFEKVTEATNDAIWDWNIETGEHFWGDGFRKLFGIDPEAEGKSLNYWENRVHPDDYEKVKVILENILKTEESSFFETEYRFLKGDGSYAFISEKGSVIRDKNGKPIRLVGAMQDISHRKMYEESLKNLNVELANSNRDLEISNKELEQFAYVASHDLQEPLRMIISFLGLIEKKYSAVLDEKGRKYIYHAVDGARRMRQIILDLLEFSRVGNITEAKKWVGSKSLVEEVLLFNQKKIQNKKAKIHLGELPDIFCHSSSVVQLFQNLISNAIKYQQPDSIPEVWIQGEDKGNFWEFKVKDNGIGIEQEYLTKIFIIFQRLHQKEQYSGSGIGLAICKKITEIHGGKIWVESTPENGSIFYFTIKK